MGLFDFFRRKKRKEAVQRSPQETGEEGYVSLIDLMSGKPNPQATDLDEIPDGKGRFGLDVTNPVPVNGVPSNEIYLSRLRRENGGAVQWRRVGSTGCENIERPIDHYEIFDEMGNLITSIYISPYHRKTSDKAPKGFKLV